MMTSLFGRMVSEFHCGNWSGGLLGGSDQKPVIRKGGFIPGYRLRLKIHFERIRFGSITEHLQKGRYFFNTSSFPPFASPF